MEKTFVLAGLDCPHCAAEIERQAAALPGVSAASVDLMRQTLRITADDGEGLLDRVRAIVAEHEPDVAVQERAAAELCFLLRGLDCPHCAALIEKEAAGLGFVEGSSLNLARQTLMLRCSALPGDPLGAVRGIVSRHEPGVQVSLLDDAGRAPAQAPDEGTEGKRRLLRLAAGAALYAALLAACLLAPLPSWLRAALFAAVYLLLGGDVLCKAARNIVRGRVFDENLLMTISTLGAFAIGEYPEAAAVMLFYQVGEYFQDRAVQRSRGSIRALLSIRAERALVRRGGSLVSTDPSAVLPGEVFLVRPGERVPLDGTVLSGGSMLDMSSLTGESLPRRAAPGDTALSGSICLDGALEIRAGKPYADSTVARIISMVEDSAARKAPTENFITSFARWYTPAVAGLALLLAVLPPLLTGGAWTEWFRRACIFLVISCPCALVISVPLAFFGGIGAASRRGILVKGGNFLEALSRADTFVFDKTGTLTKGSFEVVDAIPAPGMDKEGLLRLAAAAESLSAHPIARSVMRAVPGFAPPGATGSREAAGRGVTVEWQGMRIAAGSRAMLQEMGVACPQVHSPHTQVHVAAGGAYAGCLLIADAPKPGSAPAIAALRRLGARRIAMLTGDGEESASAAADAVGIGEYHAGLLPLQKVEWLETLDRVGGGGHTICFIGDGVNDSPAIARADVGVAMGALGSDAAIEAADVVLMSGDPARLPEAVSIARRTHAIVTQNIVFALGVKALLLILGALGLATMWQAVFGDVGVMVIAVLNSMRLLRTGPGLPAPKEGSR